MWRDVVCEHCGQRYAEFRAEGQPTFAEAKRVMIDKARQLALGGDYSKPARRSAVLGFMHEWKQRFWGLHLAECEQYHQRVVGEAA